MKLNKKQTRILYLVVMLVVGMCLYSPIKYKQSYYSKYYTSDYKFVFTLRGEDKIDFPRLALQTVPVAGIGFILIHLFRSRTIPE